LRPKASENPGAESLTNVEVELGEIHDRGETGEKLTFKGTRREGDTGRGGSQFHRSPTCSVVGYRSHDNIIICRIMLTPCSLNIL
jgi:hypothetical protein